MDTWAAQSAEGLVDHDRRDVTHNEVVDVTQSWP